MANEPRPKADRIIQECQERNEPYFVVRAQDVLSVMVLAEYQRLLELYRPSAHMMNQQIAEIRDDFSIWMESHRDLVKLPD